MNKFGKRMKKALLLGSAIVTAIALNSTYSMAAELDENVVQSIEDAVEVIEGDAVAVEGYLNQGLEAIEYNDLPYDKGQEIMNAGGEYVGQAYEKWDYVHYTREDIITETEPEVEAAQEEFVEAAKEQGVEESANRLETAETNQEKLNIVNETAEQAEKKYYEESDKNNKEQRDTEIEISDCETELAEVQKELETLKEQLDELEEIKIGAVKDLNRFEKEVVEPYRQKVADLQKRLEEANQERERLIENRNQKEKEYNQLRGELNGILIELDEANWALYDFLGERDADDLDYDRGAYEGLIDRLNSACQHYTERSEALKKLPQAANDYIYAEDRIFGFEDVIYGIQNEIDWAREDYDEEGGDEALENLTRIADEATKKYDEADAKVNELQNGVDTKASYIKSLKEKEETIIKKMESQEQQYSAFCSTSEKYRAILEDLAYIDDLYNRGYIAFSKTNSDFNTLINSVTEFWQSEQETDGEAVLEKIEAVENQLANDVEEIGKNADEIKGASENQSITILTVDNIKADSDARLATAKKNNERVHKYYEQILRALEKAEQAYNEFLDNPGDWETTFVELSTKYWALLDQAEQARKLVERADQELGLALNNYNEVIVAYDDFYKDITYVDEYREFWDYGYHVFASFKGYVKGNYSALNDSSSLQDFLDNIWGYVGVLEGDLYDETGVKVDHFKQELNERIC